VIVLRDHRLALVLASHPLADAIETFVRHEDAERFVLGFGRVVNVRDEELRSR
jgi:hypothetical protein